MTPTVSSGLPYLPRGFKSRLRKKYQVKKAFGMKLLSPGKLKQKNENLSGSK
jgi:hypothetical protein